MTDVIKDVDINSFINRDEIKMRGGNGKGRGRATKPVIGKNRENRK